MVEEEKIRRENIMAYLRGSKSTSIGSFVSIMEFIGGIDIFRPIIRLLRHNGRDFLAAHIHDSYWLKSRVDFLQVSLNAWRAEVMKELGGDMSHLGTQTEIDLLDALIT